MIGPDSPVGPVHIGLGAQDEWKDSSLPYVVSPSADSGQACRTTFDMSSSPPVPKSMGAPDLVSAKPPWPGRRPLGVRGCY